MIPRATESAFELLEVLAEEGVPVRAISLVLTNSVGFKRSAANAPEHDPAITFEVKSVDEFSFVSPRPVASHAPPGRPTAAIRRVPVVVLSTEPFSVPPSVISSLFSTPLNRSTPPKMGWYKPSRNPP
jgi:hypothetical protein